MGNEYVDVDGYEVKRIDVKTLDRVSRAIRKQTFKGSRSTTLKSFDVIALGAHRKGDDAVWDEDYDKDARPEDVAESALADAMDDAVGMGGGQHSYAFRSRVGKGSPKVLSRFTLNAGTEDDSFGGLTEKATTVQEGQRLVHTEKMHRLALRAADSGRSHMENQNERLYARIQYLEDKVDQGINLREELIQKNHERLMEVAEHELKMQAAEQFLGAAKTVVPALINRVSGRQLLPESDDPMAKVVVGILETLNTEQLAAMQGILTPDQLFGLAEIMKSLPDKGEKKLTAVAGSNGKNN